MAAEDTDDFTVYWSQAENGEWCVSVINDRGWAPTPALRLVSSPDYPDHLALEQLFANRLTGAQEWRPIPEQTFATLMDAGAG